MKLGAKIFLLGIMILLLLGGSDSGCGECFLLVGAFLEGLKPEPELTVTEWAERFRILSSKGSAEPGIYRVTRTPYLRKIMDVASARSRVKLIVVKKASQVGFTEALFNIIAYYIACVPCPILYLMPTVETMERNVKQRINPMIADCPALLAKIGSPRSRDGGNTLSQKDFPGGSLFLLGANSASALASIPARVAALDEVDRYPQDVDDEGSPIALVDRRQLTFPNKKKILGGTPTVKGASKTEAEYELTDQQVYHVPCPHCMYLQELVWERVVWVTGDYSDVHYRCAKCDEKIYNEDKTWMLTEDLSEYVPGAKDEGRARWIATRPDLADPEAMGFDLSGLYSPDGWMSWTQMAKEFDACDGDEPRLKSFYNTMLGRTYQTKGVVPAWKELMERAAEGGVERNTVWESVAFITAGADVQPDRIEVQIVGWMKGRVSQQIDYRVLPGDTTKKEVWDDLGEVLEEVWTAQERQLQIRLMALDANYNSAFVHDFARKWGTKRVIPIQGRDNLEMPFSTPKVTTKTKIGKNLPKGKVWPVGVSYLKSQLYGWLRLEVNKETGVIPNGYCHFLPLGDSFFRGITAEELVPERNKKTNAIKYVWTKRYERNEPLDTMVYALAAAYVVGFDRWDEKRWERERQPQTTRTPTPKGAFPEREERITNEVERPAAADVPAEGKKKRKGGSFWDRNR